ncbi:unnamed protein product, partial [Ixodes hexagonus]
MREKLSFSNVIFLQIYFTIFFTTGMFTITSEADPSGGGSLTLMGLAVLLAGCCVLSSVLLLVGLCVRNSSKLLHPSVTFLKKSRCVLFVVMAYSASDT